MQVIIGKLGNQPFPITEPTVSKRHAELIVNEQTGKMTLHDTNSTNGTYILDQGRYVRIKQANVSLDTVVRVGASVTFKIRDVIKKKEPEAVDISRLRLVYDNYMRNKMDIETKMGNIMMQRMLAITGGGAFAGILVLFLPQDMVGDAQATAILKAVVSLIIIILAYLLVGARNNSLIQRKYNNEEYYKKKYRCPNCGYSFGMKIFDNLVAEGKCPNCKCKFTIKK